MKNNCIFCEIIESRVPCSKVYEDEKCIAFMDIQPVNAGHVLVVPKVHKELVNELDETIIGHLFVIGARINKALRQCTSIKCEGINYFLADGEAAFQEVFHVHLHCFPRFKGDGFGLTFSEKYFQKPDRKELDTIALELKHKLES
jgi:histidine triad (HIT) family protein